VVPLKGWPRRGVCDDLCEVRIQSVSVDQSTVPTDQTLVVPLKGWPRRGVCNDLCEVRIQSVSVDQSTVLTDQTLVVPLKLEQVIEWALVRDMMYPSLASRSSSAAAVWTAAPALAPHGAGGGARSFPSRTDPSGALRPPLSPAEARERVLSTEEPLMGAEPLRVSGATLRRDVETGTQQGPRYPVQVLECCGVPSRVPGTQCGYPARVLECCGGYPHPGYGYRYGSQQFSQKKNMKVHILGRERQGSSKEEGKCLPEKGCSCLQQTCAGQACQDRDGVQSPELRGDAEGGGSEGCRKVKQKTR
jgi:hypothetical protein